MLILNKKTISMCVFILSILCEGQSFAGRKSTFAKTSCLRSDNERSVINIFQKGKGSFWSFTHLDQTGKRLKRDFIQMANLVRKIQTQSGNQVGFVSRNGGKSIRFRAPFNLEVMKEALSFLPDQGKSEKNSHHALCSKFTKSLEEFYKKSIAFLEKLGIRYTRSAEDQSLSDLFLKETNSASSFLSQFDIIRSQDWINRMGVEIRLVEGEARALDSHIDGNVYFVLSIDVAGVYEQKERNTLFLPDGKSYLWFGEVANELPSSVKEHLETCGIQQDKVVPLPHGVAASASGQTSSLLLIFSKVQSPSFRLFPKNGEFFQNFTPKKTAIN